MALPANYQKQLDDFFAKNPITTGTISSYQNLFDNLKNLGISEDDLKPYIDKYNGKLNTLGYDYKFQSNPAGGGQGSSTTPTTPSTPQPAVAPGLDDQQKIEQEASRETKQTMDAVNQAASLRDQKIGSLGDILLRQNQAQFNYDLPGIKEQLQGSGLFDSNSALAAAVARESGMLGANTQSQLAQAGLSNIDLQAEGLLGATQNAQQLQQGGLQRLFSVGDYEKQAALSREIGAMQIPNAPNPFLSALSGAGSGATAGMAFGPHGAAIGAGLGAATGAASGGSFICTHLNKLGLMSKSEVRKVHKKIFSRSFAHPVSLMAYWIAAPIFILKADSVGYNWQGLKKRVCDDILESKNSEEAFVKYMSVCFDFFAEVFKCEVTYGY